jgi:tripartite-type tricarboxylate transporter receptor subunit TctC
VPGYEATAWHGIAAPRNTPADLVQKLNEAINAGLVDPAVKAKFANLGSETAPLTPPEFAAFIRAETEKWAKVIAFAGLRAE